MNTKHSTTPWTFARNTGMGFSSKGRTVALCQYFGGAEQIAKNGHLIAAAPDLLKELQHLVDLLQPLEMDGRLNVPGLATLNGARIALSKAKGVKMP